MQKKFFLRFTCLLLFAILANSGCGPSHRTPGSLENPSRRQAQEQEQEKPAPEQETTQISGYTVTFVSNGGSSVASQNVAAGATVDKPVSPTRNGYAFAGWYTDDKNFENMFLFGSNGDKVNKNITLYANWLRNSGEELQFSDEGSAILIGYRLGDSASHVTGDLNLPTKIENRSDLTLSWSSSNPSVVTNEGKVSRPDGQESQVTLTAIISDGTNSESYPFELIVMRNNSSSSVRGQARQSIRNKDYYQVVAMNTGGNEVYFTYNSSNGARRISTIEGIYSETAVNDADDALDAIQGVHGLLGIASPSDELDVIAENSDSYGAHYSFSQVYNGVKVLGRNITVSTNNDGTTNYLASNIYPTASLSGIAAKSYTQEEAEKIALDYYEDGFCELGSAPTEEIIYTLDEYAENPVRAYVVNISGLDGDGIFLNENIFVNARTGKVICAVSNIHDATRVSARAKNEAGETVSFDVTFTDEGVFSMAVDLPPLVQIFQSDGTEYGMTDFVKKENEWNDPQAVSAYINTIKAIKWWKTRFNRNSLDDEGLAVNVVVHNNKYKNNAFWLWPSTIFICDHNGLFDYSYANTIDAVTHETTHAVLDYIVGFYSLPYRNGTGAIHEGYADIFACLHDRNWTMGEGVYDPDSFIIRNYRYSRNIAKPDDPLAKNQGPSELYGTNYIDYTQFDNDNDEESNNDKGGVHTNGFLVSHAAYLMYKNGLSWEELGDLWYKSMFIGLYSAVSDFHTVRRSVVQAARLMDWSQEKRDIIADAFDEEKIYGDPGTLSGTVTDSSGNPVSGAAITFTRDGAIYGMTATRSDGTYSIELDRDTYSVLITSSGYVDFTTSQPIDEGGTYRLDVVLTSRGTGSLSGKITDMNEQAIAGVTLSLRRGHISETRNSELGDVIAIAWSDAEGIYSFDSLPNGNYNVTVSKEDYAVQIISIAVGGETVHDISLSPFSGVGSVNQWNIWLTWGNNVAGADEPYDLDAHVIVWRPDGTYVEAYYGDKVKYVDDDVVSLDRDVIRDHYADADNQTGAEHMSFTPHAGDIVDYFVHWYRGSGTWASSNAKVRIKLPQLHGREIPLDVPQDNSAYNMTSTCWHVLRITNGGAAEEVNKIITNRAKPENPYGSVGTHTNMRILSVGSGLGNSYPPKQ